MNTTISSHETAKSGSPVKIRVNKPANQTAHKIFLACGVLSSLLYVVANVVTAALYKGYSAVSQTVSELSAIGAPTRELWVLLMIPYSLLVIAFGAGVWQSAEGNRRLRTVGALVIVGAIIGFFWPPMHQREVLAAGGGTLTDILHIVFTIVWGAFVLLMLGFGAAAFGKRFRFYSIVTLLILVIAGIFTSINGPKIQANLPTPWIGVWERINIGVYMLWVVVLAIVLLRREKKLASFTPATQV